jgi:hypothetical protein
MPNWERTQDENTTGLTECSRKVRGDYEFRVFKAPTAQEPGKPWVLARRLLDDDGPDALEWLDYFSTESAAQFAGDHWGGTPEQ